MKQSTDPGASHLDDHATSVIPVLTTAEVDDPRLKAWRDRYATNMAAAYGWWSVVSLDWLEQGENLLGSAENATLRLPTRLPERAASLRLEGASVTLTPLDATITMNGEALTGPTAVPAGTQLFVAQATDYGATDAAASPQVRVDLTQRADMVGVRVRDPRAASTRDPNSEIAWFLPDPAWRLPARFLAPERDEEVAITNRIGQTSMVKVIGRVGFEVAGEYHELLATQGGNGKLFINFKDSSNGARNGTHTYPGGRFINIDPPVDGRLTIDFNYAHHPPCAHTPYATCPIPTPSNTLPFAVLAGERTA
ncbi:MAG TPA: DUF1684 domain-containing protein [Trueperaceae bacterium]|nr:DUF1684 domain-containing protein [Trueperaceae bacterium]